VKGIVKAKKQAGRLEVQPSQVIEYSVLNPFPFSFCPYDSSSKLSLSSFTRKDRSIPCQVLYHSFKVIDISFKRRIHLKLFLGTHYYQKEAPFRPCQRSNGAAFDYLFEAILQGTFLDGAY
jgi:hypothetical protein